MKKTLLAWLLIVSFSLVLFNGCSKNLPIPELNQYNSIAIAPFASVDETSDIATRFHYDLGEKFKLKFEDINWIYDKSDTLNPIGQELKKNNASSNDLFTDPKLAAQIGKALGADIIIVGLVEKPKIRKKDSDKQYTKMGVASKVAKRYTLLKQSAILSTKLQIIDTKSSKLIWKGNIKGSTKYIKAFQAQVPEKNPVEKKTILAQLRDHVVARIAHTLFPQKFADREYPELKMRPDIKLIDISGVIDYNRI